MLGGGGMKNAVDGGMKITIRTRVTTQNGAPQMQNFDIRVEPEETILKVKKKVQTARSEFQMESMKLIASGRRESR